MKGVDLRDLSGRWLVIGLCPSKHWQRAWNQRKTHERESRATGPWSPRKESASTMADSSAVWSEWVLLAAYARCASVVMKGPDMIQVLP